VCVTELNSGTWLAAGGAEVSFARCDRAAHFGKDSDEETALPAFADDEG